MTKLMLSVLFVGILVCAASLVNAGDYTFGPTPSDMNSLTGSGDYQQWGIDWLLPNNETITSATLRINQINNTQEPVDDALDIYLSNSPNAGVWDVFSATVNGEYLTRFKDTNGYNYQQLNWGTRLEQRSYWVSTGFWGGYWVYNYVEVPYSWYTTEFANPSENYAYLFTQNQIDMLNDYATSRTGGFSPATFGLAFDASNATYQNAGISLSITTSTSTNPNVPEPLSCMLAVIGLGAISGYRKLKRA